MTARAVSGGADLRLRVVSPTFSPEKLRMGRVVESWELMERENLERGVLRSGRREKRGLEEGWEKREEEEKERERDGEVVEVAIGEEERERE